VGVYFKTNIYKNSNVVGEVLNKHSIKYNFDNNNFKQKLKNNLFQKKLITILLKGIKGSFYYENGLSNNIKNIEIRSTCSGHNKDRVTYIIFRTNNQDEDFIKHVVAKLNFDKTKLINKFKYERFWNI
jgi:hypothetical protein